MGQAIVERIISSETDRRLVLYNSQCARVMPWGSNWTRLRIGLRFAIQGSVSPLGPCRLFVGVSAGTANLFGSLNSTHSVGLVIGNSVASVSYTGIGDYYSYGGAGNFFVKRVGTTQTTLNANTPVTNSPFLAANAATRNCLMFLELIKLSPTVMECVGLFPGNSTQVANKSYALLREAMLETTRALVASHAGLATATNRSGAVDESVDGNLNAVQIYWAHPYQGFEISDCLVSKVE